jgi:DNA-binding response OmpR family regulator
VKKKILIVEDDMNINNMIKEVLDKEGCDCTQAFSGTEAVLCTRMQAYDLILLDLMLPGMSGNEFLKLYRKEAQTPVIVLSAKDELDSKVDLLSSGADDYLTKPFELRELIARVNVQLRRHALNSTDKSGEEDTLKHKNLVLNKSTMEVKVQDEVISVTRQEFKILELLLSYPNKVFSKQDIYDYAWEDYFIGEDKTINVHISNIRQKLKKYTNEDYIDTVWGIGFKLSK